MGQSVGHSLLCLEEDRELFLLQPEPLPRPCQLLLVVADHLQPESALVIVLVLEPALHLKQLPASCLQPYRLKHSHLGFALTLGL